MNRSLLAALVTTLALLTLGSHHATAQKKKATTPELPFPPTLADGKTLISATSPKFLQPTGKLADGVTIAKTAPKIDFAFFPGQTYAGNPWSTWGDSTFANGKYYASLGDHLAPAGNAFVYEFDPVQGTFRQLVDLKKLLHLPAGHYAPAKIHTTLTMGKDGWIYFGTHRGSTKVTTDQYHFKGDWLARVDPRTGKVEVIAHGPVPKHGIPTGFLDPDRLIFYGSTAPGDPKVQIEGIQFFAYDTQAHKLLTQATDGPKRAMLFAKSTGRVYYTQGESGKLMRYDPARGGDPVAIPGEIDVRAASEETKAGKVYGVSQGTQGKPAELYEFDTKTEKVTKLGPAQVGTNGYITALKVDPTGRYLYYIPGAHGGADRDGSPVVQYDLKTKTRKVIAFLHPSFKERTGAAVVGTYSYDLNAEGDTLYVTWNANRGGKVWDCVALTALHIPASER